MPAPKGNKYALGNRGGGRRGYEFTDEQMFQMRKILDWFLCLMEAVEKDKVSDKETQKLIVTMPLVLKIMDKLYPNKKHAEAERPERTPTPITQLIKELKSL